MPNSENKQTPLEIALQGTDGFPLFLDEQNVAHITLPDNPGVGVPVGSDEVKTHISSRYFAIAPEGASSEVITKALAILKSRAVNEHIQLALRIKYSTGMADGPGNATKRIEYDLVDGGHSIYVSEQGAFLMRPAVTTPTFRRYSHMMPQTATEFSKLTLPQARASLDEFFKRCTNVCGVWSDDTEPDANIQLAQVWLVSTFFPQISHPMLVLHGPHGSAKSFTTGLFRKIIDPSSVETMEIPKDEDRLIQRLHHHYCCFFDNVSFISHEKSDILCRAITGMGFSKRQLYTDSGDINFSFRRIIALNGINNPGEKADLLDRMLTLEVQPIFDKNRKTEAFLLGIFNDLHPQLTSAIFTIVQEAMQRIAEVEEDYSTKKLPRLADWAIWGECISRCLGYAQNTFMRNYFNIISVQSSAAIECNEIATTIIDYLNAGNKIDCSADALIKELTGFQQNVQEMKKTTIPQRANQFSRRLNDIKVNLEREGIDVTFTREKYRRTIKITQKEDTSAVRGVALSDSPGPQKQLAVDVSAKPPPPLLESSVLECIEALGSADAITIAEKTKSQVEHIDECLASLAKKGEIVEGRLRGMWTKLV